MTIAAVTTVPARVRWGWLWSSRTDLLWNFLPFWLGFPFAAALYLSFRDGSGDPGWSFRWGDSAVDVLAITFALYGPLIDGPHLWGTIARTYTDAAEWAERRTLFLSSLLAFALGPAIIVTPYLINLVVPLPEKLLSYGYKGWLFAFATYALYHINKQHWGFVCLYKRKNGDDPRENRIDAWFFNAAIWAPWLAMTFTPKPTSEWFRLQTAVYRASHAGFLTLVLAYCIYQFAQWRRGRVRNGSKLLYMASVLPLYYLTFACDPRVTAFWVLITSTGHCLQYHAIVWQYGTKRYGGKPAAARTLPNRIFDNVWLYALFGLGYGLFTFQLLGNTTFQQTFASLLHDNVFARLFHLDSKTGTEVGLQIMATFLSGVRLHHFYVDSKIWRVSKSPALAKDLALPHA